MMRIPHDHAITVHDNTGTMVIALTMAGMVEEGEGDFAQLSPGLQVLTEALRELLRWRESAPWDARALREGGM